MNSSWKDKRIKFNNIHQDSITLIPRRDSLFYWQPHIVLEGVVNEHTFLLSPALKIGKMFVQANGNGIASTFRDREGQFSNKDIQIII